MKKLLIILLMLFVACEVQEQRSTQTIVDKCIDNREQGGSDCGIENGSRVCAHYEYTHCELVIDGVNVANYTGRGW